MKKDLEKPLFIYDGECDFCKYWVKRLKSRVEEHINFSPYQQVHQNFQDISLEEFKRSSKLVLPDGQVLSGAGGIFKSASYRKNRGVLWFMYKYFPLFDYISKKIYRVIANNRSLLLNLTHIIWGKDPTHSKYNIASWVFIKSLAFVYLTAFISLYTQIGSLVGHNGILEVSSSLFLETLVVCGMIFSLLLLFNIFSLLSAFLTWGLYLLLTLSGGVFLSYQWDILLIESGFLALFLVSWKSQYSMTNLKDRFWETTKTSFASVFLLWWLAFRLIFESGLVKVLSGDMVWKDLTAMSYHWLTQPIPNPVAWFVDKPPIWFDRLTTFSTLTIELVVPFLFFLPRRIRFAGATIIMLHQLMIFATGNYTFLNILTIALCFLLFDDLFWKNIFGSFKRKANDFLYGVRSKAAASFLVIALVVGGVQIISMMEKLNTPPNVFVINTYGLFANMTEERPEIIIEGSEDGRTWQEYNFKYKPDRLDERPPHIAPHQPRLDWQMWFAALTAERSMEFGQPQYNQWFASFIEELLKGNDSVVNLLDGSTPFKDNPPEFIRARLYSYEFTTKDEKEETGDWWKRKLIGEYLPPVRLDQNNNLELVQDS